ncbi:MAG: hypothetical protein BMS9Abin37_1066 [Acidobacteriota bacterium]|nr:MAG: hypothetical protein BMS9Abin37_1066 [Acidobacteriota bacterium]
MRGKMHLSVNVLIGFFILLGVVSCDDLQEPLPIAPSPPPPPGFSQYQIAGHWEAVTEQGRRIAFDVTSDGRVVNGRLNFHQECNVGRWRATIDGFTADIVDDAFLTSLDWKRSGNGSILAGLILSGTYTVSGRFESDDRMVGGLISAVTDVRKRDQPTGVVCQTIHVRFDGEKEP